MANYFWRRPVEGADENNWAQYNDAHINSLTGICTCKLYDDAGTLKITKGRIGIDNDTNAGISVIDTVTTIDISGITTSNWAKIEMSISGTSISFVATDTNTGVDTNPAIIPSTFRGGYDEEKNGYYITATKRCVGLIWVGSTDGLDGIVNVLNNSEGFCGYLYVDSSQTIKLNWNVAKDLWRNWLIGEIPTWNMDTDTSKAVVYLNNQSNVVSMSGVIIDNSGTRYSIHYSDPTQGGGAGIYYTGGNIGCSRETGGFFDQAGFNTATGYIFLEFIE